MGKKQRTRIDDIALLGEELSEEQMRLAAGGIAYRTEQYDIAGCTLIYHFCDDRYDGYVSNDV